MHHLWTHPVFLYGYFFISKVIFYKCCKPFRIFLYICNVNTSAEGHKGQKAGMTHYT